MATVGAACAVVGGIAALAQAQHSGATETTVSAAGVALHSVAVELPQGEQLFEGADATAINGNCLSCHSTEMVLQQPPLSQRAWQGIVEKMRAKYKAPVAEEDVASIVGYLVSRKGAP